MLQERIGGRILPALCDLVDYVVWILWLCRRSYVDDVVSGI